MPASAGRGGLPLDNRVLLVTAYWRTNLTLRQLAPLFGVSEFAADRIIDHLAPDHRRRLRAFVEVDLTTMSSERLAVTLIEHHGPAQAVRVSLLGGKPRPWADL